MKNTKTKYEKHRKEIFNFQFILLFLKLILQRNNSNERKSIKATAKKTPFSILLISSSTYKTNTYMNIIGISSA